MATKAELEAELVRMHEELEAARAQAATAPVTLSVRVPAHLRDRVRALAAGRGTSVQAEVIAALEAALEGQ